MNQNFGEFLRDLRRDRTLSQQALAKRAQLSLRTLQYWESGQKTPRNQELQTLLQALNATPQQQITAFALLGVPRAVQQVRQTMTRQETSPPGIDPLPAMGDLLRAMRQRRGWTQAQFASAMQIRRSTVQRWERSEIFPAEESLERLSQLLEIQPEEKEALRPGSPAFRAVPGFPSLEAIEEQVIRLNRDIWQRPELIDLRFLILKRQLRLLADISSKVLPLLIRLETNYGFWLFNENRTAESRTACERCLALVSLPTTPEHYRPYPLNLASAHCIRGPQGSIGALKMLERWLPCISSEMRFTLWCDMALYAAQAGLHEEASGILKKAHSDQCSRMALFDDAEGYYQLTLARTLIYAGKGAEALSLLPPIPSGGLAEISGMFLWAEAFLASGDRNAARQLVAQAESQMAVFRVPRLRSGFQVLARRL